MSFVPAINHVDGQELLVPACATAVSASILLLHVVLGVKSVNGLLARAGILEEPTQKAPLPGIGKGPILWFRAARLLGCLGLLVLSVFPVDYGNADARREGTLWRIVQSTPYVSFSPTISDDS